MKHKIPMIALVAIIITLLAAPMIVPETQAMTYHENSGEMQLFFEGPPVVEDPNALDYNPVKINAGEEVEVTIRISNTSTTDNWFVNLVAVDSAYVNWSYEDIYEDLAPSESKRVRMTFSTDKFTREGADILNIKLYVDENGTKRTITESIHFEISSSLSASGNFNKIMGVVPNTLPEPLDVPAASALIQCC